MTNQIYLFGLIASILLLFAAIIPQQTNSLHIKRKIKALKKLAIASTALGHRKKLMIPVPLPLPLPIPIIRKHEPIISPIDPLLTITAAKAQKGYYPHFGGLYGGLGGSGGGYAWGR